MKCLYRIQILLTFLSTKTPPQHNRLRSTIKRSTQYYPTELLPGTAHDAFSASWAVPEVRTAETCFQCHVYCLYYFISLCFSDTRSCGVKTYCKIPSIYSVNPCRWSKINIHKYRFAETQENWNSKFQKDKIADTLGHENKTGRIYTYERNFLQISHLDRISPRNISLICRIMT